MYHAPMDRSYDSNRRLVRLPFVCPVSPAVHEMRVEHAVYARNQALHLNLCPSFLLFVCSTRILASPQSLLSNIGFATAPSITRTALPPSPSGRCGALSSMGPGLSQCDTYTLRSSVHLWERLL